MNLNHKNIVRYFHCWLEYDNNTLNASSKINNDVSNNIDLNINFSKTLSNYSSITK